VEGLKTLEDGTETTELFTTYTLNELAEIANNTVAVKEDSTKPKVSLSFELNRSHILKLTKASAEIIETKVEEITPKKEEPKTEDKKDDDKKESENKDEAKDETKTEEKKDGDAKEGEAKTEDKPEEKKEPEPEPKKEYKTTKVPHTYAIAIKEK